MDSFEREKNKTKELIQRVKDYLMGQCSVVPQEPGPHLEDSGSVIWSVYRCRDSHDVSRPCFSDTDILLSSKSDISEFSEKT